MPTIISDETKKDLDEHREELEQLFLAESAAVINSAMTQYPNDSSEGFYISPEDREKLKADATAATEAVETACAAYGLDVNAVKAYIYNGDCAVGTPPDGGSTPDTSTNGATASSAIITSGMIINRVIDKHLALYDITPETVLNYMACEELVQSVMYALDLERRWAVSDMSEHFFRELQSTSKGAGEDKLRASAAKDANSRIPVFRAVPPDIITAILCRSGLVRALHTGDGDEDKDYMLIARVYKHGAPTIWREVNTEGSGSEIAPWMRNIEATLTRAMRQEVVAACMVQARELDPDLQQGVRDDVLWLGNGVLDGRGVVFDVQNQWFGGEFVPYGSDGFEDRFKGIYTICYNSTVDLVEQQGPVVVHCDDDTIGWEVISGLQELFPDGDWWSVPLILKIAQGAVRGTNFGNSWIFMNKNGAAGGGNGKGTTTTLIDHLVGPSNVCRTSIYDMGRNEFGAEGIIGKRAIVSHETQGVEGDPFAVDTYKNLCRQEGPIEVRRKHLPPVTIRWQGMMIQEMNGDVLKPKDNTDSTWSPVQFLDFEKTFRNTPQDRKYIKDDYIRRKEVLEYLLWYVLRKIDWAREYPKDALAMIAGSKKDFIDQTHPVYQFLDEIFEDGYSTNPYDRPRTKKPKDRPAKCPACGATIKAGEMYCGDCGAPRGPMDVITYETPDGDPAETDGVTTMLNLKRVPALLLLALYKGWATVNNIKFTPRLQTFKSELRNYAAKHDDTWTYTDGKIYLRVVDGRDEEHKALAEYARDTQFGRLHSDDESNMAYAKDPYHLTQADKMRRYTGGLIAKGYE